MIQNWEEFAGRASPLIVVDSQGAILRGTADVLELRFVTVGGDPFRTHPYLDLALEIDNEGVKSTVSFGFDLVASLKVREFIGSRPGQTQISGFEIHDISDRQWEDWKIEVLDYEDNRLSFLARSAGILTVE